MKKGFHSMTALFRARFVFKASVRFLLFALCIACGKLNAICNARTCSWAQQMVCCASRRAAPCQYSQVNVPRPWLMHLVVHQAIRGFFQIRETVKLYPQLKVTKLSNYVVYFAVKLRSLLRCLILLNRSADLTYYQLQQILHTG